MAARNATWTTRTSDECNVPSFGVCPWGADGGTENHSVAMGTFSAFVLYDWTRVQDGRETNCISATPGVCRSLYSLSQPRLALFGLTSASND